LLARQTVRILMISTIRQHAGTFSVAAAVIAAAFAQGLFDPTGYAAASIVVWAAVVAGLLGRALPTRPVGRLAAAAGLCFAVTVVLATGSVGWASDQGRAFEEAVRASFFLGLFALALCTGRRGDRVGWLTGLTVGLSVVAVLALFAYMQPGVLDSGHSDIPNAAGRLSYPIGYWNGSGAMLAATALLLAYAGAQAPTRAWRSLATALIPLAVLGVWLTSSRGAGFGLLVGVIVLVGASADRARRLVPVAMGALGAAVLIGVAQQLGDLTSGVTDSAMRADGDLMTAVSVAVAGAVLALAWYFDGREPRVRISRRLALTGVLVAVALIVIGVVAADPSRRLHEFEKAPPTRAGVAVGAADLSSNGRWQFWGEAIDALGANPFGGVGAGGYEDWWGRHATVALFVRNPHSLPLQQASELGIPGLLLFCGFVVALAIAAFRRLRDDLAGDVGVLVAVVVAGGIGAAVDWTWEFPAVFGPAVICAALLLASAPSRPLPRGGRWLGMAAVATAWVAMAAGAVVVLTHVELDRSRDAATADRIDDGIASARAARTVQPWSAEPYTQLALLEEQRGDFPAALSELRQAEDRDSEDWRLPLIEARLQVRRGDLAASTRAIKRAEGLSPLPLNSLIGGFVSENQG
jgi:O-antigen ligase/polysaccharide polymerase Wzy-like membrane protein